VVGLDTVRDTDNVWTDRAGVETTRIMWHALPRMAGGIAP
jgi:hypothetical protein